MNRNECENGKEKSHYFFNWKKFQSAKGKIQGSSDGMFVTAKVTEIFPPPPAAGRSPPAAIRQSLRLL